MFALSYQFCMQTTALCYTLEQRVVGVKPVERLSLDVSIYHLVIYFSIICSIEVKVETSVLIFVDVFEVGGIYETCPLGLSKDFKRSKRVGRLAIFPAMPVPFIKRRMVSKPLARLGLKRLMHSTSLMPRSFIASQLKGEISIALTEVIASWDDKTSPFFLAMRVHDILHQLLHRVLSL